MHKITFKLINNNLCARLILSVCREAVKKYEHLNVEQAFRRLKDYRNFSEDTKINALNEIYERSSNSKRINWMSDILNELDSERKATFLKLIFYNIILNGFHRKIINARLKVKENFVPNLSSLLLAPFSKCNLDCIGCESSDDRDDGAATYKQLDYILKQAKRLHIFHVIIIGKGEPFYDESHKKIMFRLMKKIGTFFLFALPMALLLRSRTL